MVSTTFPDRRDGDDLRCPSNLKNGTAYPHEVPTVSMSSQMIARAPGCIAGVGKLNVVPGGFSPRMSFSNSGVPRSMTLPVPKRRRILGGPSNASNMIVMRPFPGS